MKVTKDGNLRIVVEPKGLFDNKLTSSLVEYIKQRSDDIKSIYVEWGVKDVCSYYDQEWRVNNAGCPTCCLEAMREYKDSLWGSN